MAVYLWFFDNNQFFWTIFFSVYTSSYPLSRKQMLEALEVEKLSLAQHNLYIIWKPVKEEYSVIYKQPECMPDKIGLFQSVSSTAAREIYWIFFPISMTMRSGLPLLDLLVSKIDFQFNKLSVFLFKLLFFIPSVIYRSTIANHFNDGRELYQEGILNYEVIDPLVMM